MHRFSHQLHQGILQFRAEGHYSVATLQAALGAAIAAIPAGEQPNLLLDLRHSTSLATRAPADIARIASQLARHQERLGPRFAVVVGTDLQAGRLDASNGHIPPGTFRRPHIFRDMLQAITWQTEAGNRSAARAAHPLGAGLPD